MTLRSAEEDCLLATARLCQHTGSDAVGVIGTRWGAFVAARAAGGTGAAAIAFWDAKPDGRGYVDELIRTKALRDLWDGNDHPAGFYDRRLAAGHPLDIHGFRVHPQLVASSLSESLCQCLEPPLPTRLVYGAGNQPDAQRLRSAFEKAGCKVTVTALTQRTFWWVALNPLLNREDPTLPLEMEAERTAAWFRERLDA